MKRLLKLVALLGLTGVAYPAASSPPAGNYIANVSTISARPAINISSATIRDQLRLTYISTGSVLAINSLGVVVSTTITSTGGGGGGGSTNGSINAASQFSAGYYSLNGSSTVISGSSISIYPSTMTVGSPTSTSLGNTSYVTINSSGTSKNLTLNISGQPSGGVQNKVGGFTINALGPGGPPIDMFVLRSSYTSSQGGSAMMSLWQENPLRNDPMIWLHRVNSDSSPEMRWDSPSPNMEMVMNSGLDNTIGEGKWEPFAIAAGSRHMQCGSNRANDNGTFENLCELYPLYSATEMPGVYYHAQTLANDSGILSSSDTASANFFSLNSHTVGITGPQNPSASYVFGLPDTVGASGQIWYNSGNRGGNFNVRQIKQSTDMTYSTVSGLTVSTITVTSSATFKNITISGTCTGSGCGIGGGVLPGGATSYIQNTSTLQSGATFNTPTGTIGELAVTTVTLAPSAGLGSNSIYGPNNSIYMGPGAGNQSSQYQIGIGVGAISTTTYGTGGIGIGFFAGSGNGSVSNIAIGEQAIGQAATVANNNIAIGKNAMSSPNGSTSNNISIGQSSLQNITSYGESTAIGWNALNATTSGFENHAIGVDALRENTTGFRNVALGSQSLIFNLGGVSNTAIGDNAGGNSSTFPLLDTSSPNPFDSGNTYIGAQTGTTSSSTLITLATAIGYSAHVGCSNCISIGSASNPELVRVGISTTTPTHALEIDGATGVSVKYNVNAGSTTGSGLTTCGDSSHALGYDAPTGQFSCQSVTGTGGGGGASSLAVTIGVARSSPTSDIIFNPNQFTGSVSGSSMSIVLNSSSVTLQGNNLSATYLTQSSATATYLNILQGLTQSSATATYLQQSSATATYLQLSSATATYLNKNNAITLASFSATQPIIYNNATGAFTSTLISLSTGATGTLQAAQEPAHTGDVTNSAGSLAMTAAARQSNITTLAASSVTVTSTFQVSSNTVIVSTFSTPALNITANGTYGVTNGTSGGLLVNCTGGGQASGMCSQIYSNAGAQLALGGLLNLITDNTAWNEPGLFILRAGTNNNSDIRVEAGGNPAITMIDDSQANASAGKFQWSIHSGDLRIEGRNAANTAFDSSVVISSMASYGDVTFGQGYNFSTNSQVLVVTSTNNAYSLLVETNTTTSRYIAISTNSEINLSGSVGTNGQVVTSGGPGVAPTWTTIAGSGDVVKASTQTLTGSNTFSGSTQFSSSITVPSTQNFVQSSFGTSWDGGGSALTAGTTYWLVVPATATVKAFQLTGLPSGSISVQVSSSSVFNTGLTPICSAACPAFTSATSSSNFTLNGQWTTTTLAKDSYLYFVINTVSTVTQALLSIEYIK